MKETRYYLMNTTVGRRIIEDDVICDNLFREGRWAPDWMFILRRSLAFARLREEGKAVNSGWDDGMGPGVRELTEREAMELITDQTMDFLIAKWKKEYAEDKREWDIRPQWFAKFVTTEFILNGVKRKLTVDELGLDRYYEGFFESIQHLLEKDLEAYGAVITASYGFLD